MFLEGGKIYAEKLTWLFISFSTVSGRFRQGWVHFLNVLSVKQRSIDYLMLHNITKSFIKFLLKFLLKKIYLFRFFLLHNGRVLIILGTWVHDLSSSRSLKGWIGMRQTHSFSELFMDIFSIFLLFTTQNKTKKQDTKRNGKNPIWEMISSAISCT